MGVYYFYVNDTKREYFCIDPTGVNIKQHSLGDNIGSRALCYLLLQNDSYFTGVKQHPLMGSWIGDQFFIIGDDYCPTFAEITANFKSIDQAIIEMLIDIAPYDLVRYGGIDWLIRLVDDNGQQITITDTMRRRLLKEFRHQRHLGGDADLDRVIFALRPKP